MGLIGEYIYSQQLSGDKKGFSIPFSPPASLLLNLKFTRDRLWNFYEPYALMDFRFVASQDRIVPPEDPTPGYHVIHLGIGSTIRFKKQAFSFAIQVQNLLNGKYFDHTSYYRLINIPEPGRSVVLNISVPFSGQLN
jgi:iron complex outermembrane receptor protein